MKAILFLVVSAFILVVTAGSNEAQALFSFREGGSACSSLLRAVRRTLVPEPYLAKLPQFLKAAFFFHPEADGGGDGGGDGGSGAGDGGDGSGDGSGSGDTGSGVSDSSGSASDSAGPSDNGDPDADPSVSDNNGVADISPPSVLDTVTTVDFAAQQAYDAVANPFGGVPNTAVLQDGVANRAGAEPVPGSPGGPRNPGSPGRIPNAVPPPPIPPIPPTANPPSRPRAEIHAVIVSGLADPSQVLTGSVHLTGGIVALGSADSTAPEAPGRWDPNVKITPDPELLNGHKIPPLVPNVIDVRIMHHEISATMESAGSISGQPEPALNNAGRGGP